MDKKIITLLFCFLTSFAFSQPVFDRSKSSANVTVQDARLFTQLAFKLPVYTDTTEANATHNLDSAGMQIYTKVDRTVWVREIPPRIWTKLISSVDNTNTYYGIDSITYSGNNICQWQSGVAICYNIIGQGTPAAGIDSVHVYGNSFCQFKNGDSTCYTIVGNVLQSTIDSVTVVGSDICSWLNGAATCYTISTNNPAQVVDTIYFTSPPFYLLDPKTVTMDSVSSSLYGYVTPIQHEYWNNKQDTGVSWNKSGNLWTNPANDFIGTIDNVGLDFRTNNSSKMTLATNGELLLKPKSTGNTQESNTLGFESTNNVGTTKIARIASTSDGDLQIGAQGTISLTSSSAFYIFAGTNPLVRFNSPVDINVTSTTGGIKLGNQYRQIGPLAKFSFYGASIDLSSLKNYAIIDSAGAFGVGDSITTVPRSAIAEFRANDRGVLMPRLTTTQRLAISLPDAGLELYDTNFNAKMVWDGTRWTGYRYDGTKFQGFNGTTWIDLN